MGGDRLGNNEEVVRGGRIALRFRRKGIVRARNRC
jgi:hypothetical protein